MGAPAANATRQLASTRSKSSGCTAPPPTHTLFSGGPRAFRETLAYEVDRSVRLCGPHIGGDRVNKSPKLALTLLECFLCSLPLIDVEVDAKSVNDLALTVAQRFAHGVKPSVHPIRASDAVYYPVRRSS
jgi:hypothetical protein